MTFKSSENQRVVNQLVTEVKGLNENFLTQHIRGADNTHVHYAHRVYFLRTLTFHGTIDVQIKFTVDYMCLGGGSFSGS